MSEDVSPRLAELEAELERLRRINDALMDRVEREMAAKQSDYSLFETAAMLEDVVRSRTAELVEVNQRLRDEIAHRRRIEEALQQAKREADRANDNKTKFLAAVSHDLLQPLNAARLMLEVLKGQGAAPGVQAVAQHLEASLRTMESLLNSLIDISKLEAGVIEVRRRHFRLDPLLQRLAAEYRMRARLKGLTLRLVASRACAYSDPELLERILRNLLGNAVRYTRRGGILLGVRRQGQTLSIEVRDSGPGIPADQLQEVFREFKQLPNADPDAEKGLGLGLAIVERIARMLGSEVAVRSWLGRGSVFAVSVPRGDPHQVAADAPVAALAADAGRLCAQRIAVLENDRASLESMCALLESWECRVLPAASLAELQRRLRDGGIDLLVADYHLDGDEDGLQAGAWVSERLGPDCPVLIVTSNRAPALAAEVKRRGWRLLYKPLQPAKLRALLNHLAGRGRAS
ncbi:MAG TPA: hybrid sensor histidine kinase/response regulator [Candidatus Competibacteraceae bacterium]|nr:hybrid sensor histidine kinase/response regulator [Candidatus Competibacteraceae bacterium]